MSSLTLAKLSIIGSIGTIGAIISTLFGGWDGAMTTLIIFMGIDYLTGIIVAGVFKKSNKTEGGALESRAGFKGLCRKGGMLLIVLIAVRLDMSLGTNYLKDMVVIAFVSNEALSVVENAGLMGVPVPKKLLNAIESLKSIGESEEK